MGGRFQNWNLKSLPRLLPGGFTLLVIMSTAMMETSGTKRWQDHQLLLHHIHDNHVYDHDYLYHDQCQILWQDQIFILRSVRTLKPALQIAPLVLFNLEEDLYEYQLNYE